MTYQAFISYDEYNGLHLSPLFNEGGVTWNGDWVYGDSGWKPIDRNPMPPLKLTRVEGQAGGTQASPELSEILERLTWEPVEA